MTFDPLGVGSGCCGTEIPSAYGVPYASYKSLDNTLWIIFRMTTGDCEARATRPPPG